MCEGESTDPKQMEPVFLKGDFCMEKKFDPKAAEYVLRLIFKGERNAEAFRKKVQSRREQE